MRRLSWQNLNDNGSGWRHGRAWLQLGRRELRLEWTHLKNPELGAVLAINHDERGWLFHLSLLFGTWYVGSGEYSFTARRFGIELIMGDWLRVFLGRRDADWDCKASGWEWSVHLLDVLLGRAQYREGAKHVTPVLIPMPERAYRGTVTMREDSWKRARWFRRIIRRADITMEPGEQIPEPGKGENAYDCDEDATFSLTTPARDVPAAIGKMVESVMRTRLRHGGLAWAPAPKTPKIGG